MKRAIRQRDGGEESRSINLTPMLDVVFIMLIFFIVTATFVKEQGLPVNPPEPGKRPPDGVPSSIVVRIDGHNQIHVEQRLVDVRNVAAHLARLHAERPEAPVVIRAADASEVDTLVRVMDSARKVGIDAIQFAETGSG